MAPGRVLSDRQSGVFCRPNYLDGPTLDAPDCIADDHRKNNADAKRLPRASFEFRKSPFGEARELAFWPSPHPRIRWTVASPGCANFASRPPRPPPSRVPKCPTRCLSMPPTRRRPGLSWSAAIASKNLISRPHSANSFAAISISPRSRALNRRYRPPSSNMAATGTVSSPSAKFIPIITRSPSPIARR